MDFTIKNRGALSNPEGRYEPKTHEVYDDGWERELEELPTLQTQFFLDPVKSIISRNDSPDIGFEQSINPYKGCEHGCIYCYARPSHGYLNLSSGLDFETKIFYKENAALILEKEITKSNYECKPIMLGANTDPYQPAEQKFKITRSILEVLNKYQHPVTVITKNSMIERDIDILVDMAKNNLVKVAVSITSLNNAIKISLEPRTSTPAARLRAVAALSQQSIPVRVMVAPIIPMITDCELEDILKASANAGAKAASYVLVRLPHEVKDLFKEWLAAHFPERAEHVMSLIKQMRGGKEYDSTFGERMTGKGEFAELLEKRFRIACKRLNLNSQSLPPLNTNLFKHPTTAQLSLWYND